MSRTPLSADGLEDRIRRHIVEEAETIATTDAARRVRRRAGRVSVSAPVGRTTAAGVSGRAAGSCATEGGEPADG